MNTDIIVAIIGATATLAATIITTHNSTNKKIEAINSKISNIEDQINSANSSIDDIEKSQLKTETDIAKLDGKVDVLTTISTANRNALKVVSMNTKRIRINTDKIDGMNRKMEDLKLKMKN